MPEAVSKFQPPPPPPPPPSHHHRDYHLGLILGLVIPSVCCFFGIFCLVGWRMKQRKLETAWELKSHARFSAHLIFKDIHCYLPSGRKILSGISGIAYPGKLTAILGPSGAGKTSLIDILARRKNTGRVTGTVSVNGDPNYSTRITGYVMQDDKMIGTLTVREHMWNVAMLRLPDHMPYSQKMKQIDSVLEELHISHIADSFIGTSMTRGISGGERRRLAIATELLTDPPVLFLDEPTTGLDSSTALKLIRTLKNLAENSERTIVMTIHQPGSQLYNLFDDVMLLCRGQVVYYGEAPKAVDYFSEQDIHCEENYNPADFLLDIVSEQPPEKIQKLAGLYSNSVTFQEMTQSPSGLSEMRMSGVNEFQKQTLSGDTYSCFGLVKDDYASPFWLQFAVLTYRNWINNWRNPYVFTTMYAVTILVAVVLGNIFWKVTPDLSGIQNRAGSLFFLVILISFASVTAILAFSEERPVFVRERASGMYGTLPYFLSKVVADFIPMRVIPPVFLVCIAYYMIGLNEAEGRFGFCLLTFMLISMAAGSMAFMISAAFEDISLANLVAMLLLLFYLLFGGLLLNTTSVPDYVSWLNFLSFINFGLEILMVNELLGEVIYFNPKDLKKESISIPVDGKIFLANFNWSADNWNRDFILLGFWICCYLTISFLFLRFVVKERR